MVGDDLGMQSGPQMSRAVSALFLPRHKRSYSWRATDGARVFLRCCGGVYPLIRIYRSRRRDFNPVQTARGTCEPERLSASSAAISPLGRRMRYPGPVGLGNARTGARRCAPAAGDLHARRRVRVEPGAQRHGRCAAGKRRRHAGSGHEFGCY